MTFPDSHSETAPLQVVLLPEPRPNQPRTVVHASYVHEILTQAGLGYGFCALEDLLTRLNTCRVLLTIGDTKISAEIADPLEQWLQGGGQWIAFGGCGEMYDTFGVATAQSPAPSRSFYSKIPLGEGYLKVNIPAWADYFGQPLHFFGGIALEVTTATVHADVWSQHQHPTQYIGLSEQCHPGGGKARLVAVDLVGSVVRIQQGRGVLVDSCGFPDGCTSTADNHLKIEDGTVLDWVFDRQALPEEPGLSMFLNPVADQWRDLLLRLVMQAAQEAKACVPVLWRYPRNLPTICHLSHDTDFATNEMIDTLLEATSEAEVKSTWCVIPPGYDGETLRKITDQGHELAIHFDALTGGQSFTAEEFHRQVTLLRDQFGEHSPSSNKNHYTRWEGYSEFFRWCEAEGITFDSSFGGSKTGTQGFLFGTALPFHPVDGAGALIDVLELPFTGSDLEHFTSAAAIVPLLDAVERYHGIFHSLHHPGNIVRPHIRAAFRELFSETRRRKLEWWLARDIDQWERSRRTFSWQWDATGELLQWSAPKALQNATFLFPVDSGFEPAGDGWTAGEVERWGINFRFFTCESDLEESGEIFSSKSFSHSIASTP